LRKPNLGKTNSRVILFIRLRFVLHPLSDSIKFLTLTRLVVVINFVNFSFALFTPPSRQLSDLTKLLALMTLRSDGRRVGAGGGWRRRVSLVVDHFLHLLLLVATPMRLGAGR
jgi:hypothetical protein